MNSEQNPIQKPEIHTTAPNTNDPQPKQPADQPLELHIDEPKQDHYVLNLKNYNIKPQTPSENAKASIEQKSQKIIQTATQAASQTVQKTKTLNFSKLRRVSNNKPNSNQPESSLKANLKFVFNTIVIFIITFVALNWGSYSQVFLTYYNQVTGQTDTTLQVFSGQSDTSNPTNSGTNLVYASSSIINENLNIPKLNQEVTPPGTRIIIPSINTNVPVIDVPEDKLLERNWTALENEIQNALRSGVVHYPGTPMPGQSGNVVITGHSSYYPWDPGRFKDVFAVLHNLKEGDEIIVFHRQQKYTYQVGEIKKVYPYEVDVLNDFSDDRLTLITCTPIGTNLKRLIITAFPVE